MHWETENCSCFHGTSQRKVQRNVTEEHRRGTLQRNVAEEGPEEGRRGRFRGTSQRNVTEERCRGRFRGTSQRNVQRNVAEERLRGTFRGTLQRNVAEERCRGTSQRKVQRKVQRNVAEEHRGLSGGCRSDFACCRNIHVCFHLCDAAVTTLLSATESHTSLLSHRTLYNYIYIIRYIAKILGNTTIHSVQLNYLIFLGLSMWIQMCPISSSIHEYNETIKITLG